MNAHQITHQNRPFQTLTQVRLAKSPEAFEIPSQQTCSNKGGRNQETNNPFSVSQRIKTDHKVSQFQKIAHEFKTITELKASRETNNTITESEEKFCDGKTQSKSTSRTEEIGNLLSQFKNKYANIQQKYSLPTKTQNQQISSKFQPTTHQNTTFKSHLDNPVNKLLAKGSQTPVIKSPNMTVNGNSNFGVVEKDMTWNTKKPSSLLMTSAEREQLAKNPHQVTSPTVDTKSEDKLRFRATFGPTKNNPIVNIPARKIKQAQQHLCKFSKCKDVQSEEENEEQDQTSESIVLEKFSSDWRKLKRAQTLQANPEKEFCFLGTTKDQFKRIPSLQASPFPHGTNN